MHEIFINGTAKNTKAGAVVISDDDKLYFIDSLSTWDSAYYNRKVTVSGTLKVETYSVADSFDEAGNLKQSSIGEKNIIINAKWELIE